MSKEEAKREETREQQSQSQVHHEQEIDKKPSATASPSSPSQQQQPHSQNPSQATTTPTPTTPNPSSTTTQTQTTTDTTTPPTTTTSPTTETLPLQLPLPLPERQVIAVSASKNPAAFFNLARRFLVTDEFCDLSALEGAIVSAVDAAHLLERSKLANIVRIQTSYVTVEPRKKHAPPQLETVGEAGATTPATHPPPPPHYQQQQSHTHTHTRHQHQHQHKQYQQSHTQQQQQQTTSGDKKPHHGKKGNPLRRSRIIITVQRTKDYKTWLEENGGVDDDNDHTVPSLS
uniref:DNA/RNA-binding protein Alba-like domain-containing protein n=1 Tax=Chaetoceros debilis TaxID=122233 RepID=A0A7S3QA87_9STRA|mmetsp:Transcript_21599/g.32834  ORF Transcript_21599/g.32834 Transcript_21599/m.32834 type:complete len:288 (+) Transcript_21599:507-1370(+)|eukprot:CAMPEP_0194077890 /NCGR_PEP_ID=MMETSP0149-20130528/4429_1 /TAXON_ID=122233 /ORGANISM="Chaetoceros debilis, Strain MM31A-1" /LENGTH=287 /DNA_ID=CAMNT_0038759039 /DNA_START=558 /DNA_END=1421 /DNA_ORIENTATION=+